MCYFGKSELMRYLEMLAQCSKTEITGRVIGRVFRLSHQTHGDAETLSKTRTGRVIG